MANSTYSGTGSTERNSAERTSGSSSTATVRDLHSEGGRIAEQASEIASDLYGRASTWFQGDSGRIVGFVAAGFAIGLFGFFIGRGTSSSSSIMKS